MIRMVRTPEGTVTFDITGRLPGRGAWVCAETSCLETALNRRKLSRAFHRETAAPTVPAATTLISDHFRRRMLGLLGLAARAGSVVSGHDAVARRLAEGDASLIILARDASSRTIEDLRARAGSVPVMEAFSAAEIGSSIGRPDRAVMIIVDPAMARAVLDIHDKSARLGLNLNSRGVIDP
jgi:predicted RNA-binding protein YlxR (DUF448 family)/ribosomal protein L30E